MSIHNITEVMKMINNDDFEDYPIDLDLDRYGVGASAYDCTGLIPKAPQSDDEEEAYEEIYPYRGTEE